MDRVRLQLQLSGALPGWRFWLFSLAITLACVILVSAALAPTALGRQAVNMLRFAFGWHHIARQQQQLLQALEAAFQRAGLSIQSRRPGIVRPQRRGQEYWQYQTYRVQVPPQASLELYEAILRDTIKALDYTVFRRFQRLNATQANVAITIGTAGVPTNTFVFSHPHKTSPAVFGNAQMAIVIDDLGWDLEMAHALLALDIPLSFAILPDAPYRMQIAQEVQRRGYDVLLHLPMEPHQYPEVNPGYPVLLSTMTPSQLAAQIEAALHALPIAVGVSNHMGSRLTENREVMQTVMQQLKHYNLFFLDSRTTKRSLAYQVAQEMGVPTAQRHVFLDNEIDTIKIHQQLRHLARRAYNSGRAIGIGHPYPETVQVLRSTLIELSQEGIDIVPVSRLVK